MLLANLLCIQTTYPTYLLAILGLLLGSCHDAY